MARSRGEQRSGFDIPTRLRLVEDDADEISINFNKLIEHTDSQIDEFRKAAAQNRNILIGILTATTTTAIGLALNLIK